MSSQSLSEVLCQNKFLAKLSTRLLDGLAASAKYVDFPENTVVFREGSEAGTVYMLVSGELSITAMGEGQQQRNIGTVRPTELFGEHSAIIGGGRNRRNASATTRTACRAIAIPARQFEAAITGDAMVLREMKRHAVDLLLHRITGSEIIGILQLPSADLSAVTSVVYANGERVFSAGTAPDAAYVILSGTVTIRKEDTGETIATMRPGQLLGELGVFDGKPRAATALAAGSVTLLRFSASDFIRLSQQIPALHELIERKLRNYGSRSGVSGSSFLAMAPVICSTALTGGLGGGLLIWTGIAQGQQELLVGGAVVASVALASCVWTYYAWVLQVRRATDFVRKLSEGQRGLTMPGEKRSGVFGEMARSLTTLQSKLKSAEQVASGRIDEQQRKIQRQEEIARSVREFRGEFRKIIAEVLASVEKINQVSALISSGAERATKGVEMIQSHSTASARSVHDVVAATDTLRGAIADIERLTQLSEKHIRSSDEHMTRVSASLQELDTVVNSIGGILELIHRIAEQTKLLALNASIEASRAGRAGKGFGVVAKEVHQLADRTSQATEEISQKVASVQSANVGVAKAMVDITGMITQLTAGIELTLEAMSGQTHSIHEITDSVEVARETTTGVQQSILDISKVIDDSNGGAASLNEASLTLTQRSERLKTEIETFLQTVSD